VVGKLLTVLRDDKLNTRADVVEIANFQDLHVVAGHIRGHLVWRNVDDIDVRVLGCKDPADLGIFTLDKLLHRHTLKLVQ